MERLEDDYPGDADWHEYVALYKEDYLDDNARQLAAALGGDLDMAVIIYGKRGLKEGLWWIDKPVPALDNLTPLECTQEPRLVLRLRSALMRMP